MVVGVLLIVAIPVSMIVSEVMERSGKKRRARARLSDITKIDLWRARSALWNQEKDERVVVTDPSSLKEMMDSLSLTSKSPCGCAHFEGADFYKEDGEFVRVSICSHCFSMGGNEGEFEMPGSFYRQFASRMKH